MRREERDESDRPGGGHGEAGQHHGGAEQQQPRALDAQAEAARDVVAEPEDVDLARQDEQRRAEHRRRRPRAATPAPSRGR